MPSYNSKEFEPVDEEEDEDDAGGGGRLGIGATAKSKRSIEFSIDKQKIVRHVPIDRKEISMQFDILIELPFVELGMPPLGHFPSR